MSRGLALLTIGWLRISLPRSTSRSGTRHPARHIAERGDVPGWVLVTLMTAGLVLTLWAVAGPRLEEVFNDAIDTVVGGP